jgi:predicted DNA-binding antitoxin AbrB/MazE fold protein
MRQQPKICAPRCEMPYRVGCARITVETESDMTVDAIYSGGVFRPLGDVAVGENQRVRLTIESSTTAVPPIRTAQDLLDSNLAGIWAGREDIEDSRAFARRLREAAQTRDGSAHAAG